MRDVLITGGIGKIGFDLVNQLLDTKCNITLLDLESKTSVKKIQKIKQIKRSLMLWRIFKGLLRLMYMPSF